MQLEETIEEERPWRRRNGAPRRPEMPPEPDEEAAKERKSA
jgi:hypothetical protein